MVTTRIELYDLPGGSIGKEFVGLLADEIRVLCNSLVKSERLIVFCGLLLQRDNMVKKGSDIRRLLKRRMDTWRKGCFDELLYECIRCARQSPRGSGKPIDDDHVLKVFTRLMLKGQVRFATRWITDRAPGSVLSPLDIDNGSGKNVFEVLKDKHPEPGTRLILNARNYLF